MNKTNYESLYPDILFHFTTKEGLFSILENEFRVSYARERIKGKSTERKLAVPMVSFCDLKLSELKIHMEKYGLYGIGLSKEWANQNGLNPVMYVSEFCEFTDNFNNALYQIYPKLGKLRKSNKETLFLDNDMKILDAYRYMKNYEGELIRDEIVTPNFRFADEREWRYVPSLSDLRVDEPFVAITNISTRAEKEKYNNKIKDVKLRFNANDIKYLIIEKESEITELINHIKHVKKHYDEESQERLLSRILTSEQIKKDV